MEASDGVAVEQSRARGWALMWISVQVRLLWSVG